MRCKFKLLNDIITLIPRDIITSASKCIHVCTSGLWTPQTHGPGGGQWRERTFVSGAQYAVSIVLEEEEDAALLRREYSQHNIFKDSLFETPEYIQFEEAVAVAVGAAKEEDPQLVVIQTGLKNNDSSI